MIKTCIILIAIMQMGCMDTVREAHYSPITQGQAEVIVLHSTPKYEVVILKSELLIFVEAYENGECKQRIGILKETGQISNYINTKVLVNITIENGVCRLQSDVFIINSETFQFR